MLISEYMLVTVNSAVLLVDFFQYLTFSHYKAFSLNTLLRPIKTLQTPWLCLITCLNHTWCKSKSTHPWKIDLCSSHWLQRNFWKVLKTLEASVERSYLVQCSMSPLGPLSRQIPLAVILHLAVCLFWIAARIHESLGECLLLKWGLQSSISILLNIRILTVCYWEQTLMKSHMEQHQMT